MAEASIRRCVPGDEQALALVGQATFLETFAGVLGGQDIIAHCARAHAAELYLTWLSDPDYALWLVEIQPGNAPVGYMVIAPAKLPLPNTADDLEIKRIYVLSKFQGEGLGKRLISTAVAHSSAARTARLLLGVYAHNEPAIGFYEHFGFNKLGTRQFNVGGQDYDDNIMGMPLNAQSTHKGLPVHSP